MRLSRPAFLFCAAALLAACQGSLPGKTSADVTPNAVAGDPIEVTALDAPAAAPPEAAVAAEPAGTETAAPQAAPGPVAAAADAGSEAAAAEPAPKPAAVEAPEVPAVEKSEKQLACEKKKGRWSKIGKGDARACIFQTRDAGKRCDRESQCESACLARSGTCAPFKPLFGCNEILQDNGMRVTQCLD